MNRLGWTIFGVLVALVAAIIAGFMLWPKAPLESMTPPIGDTGDLTGQSIYANGEYGFTLMYPGSAKQSDGFSLTSYMLGSDWRAQAPANSTGTPVVQIVGYSTLSDHSFPRDYAALIRVGVATSSADVAACTKVTPDTGEMALPDVTVNGTIWKAFQFEDAAMMHYEKGISYRTVHDGKCYAMEKLAVGSSYKDDPDSPDDIPQATLDKAYADLDAIVQSFTFSKP